MLVRPCRDHGEFVPAAHGFYCTRYAFMALKHIGSVIFKFHLNRDRERIPRRLRGGNALNSD